MRRITWLGFILLSLSAFSVFSDSAFTQRKDVQRFIKTMVKQHHFTQKEMMLTMRQVQLQPQIIQSMDRPFEKKSWDVYRDLFMTADRLKGGIAFWQKNQKALEKAYKQYGVPPEIIIAILGVETLYGDRQGNNRVLDSLATLAFNYPKRAAYFRRELEEYLLLCREHRVSPTKYVGSYAGAMGKPQFMPSNYRIYAVDFNNKGSRDLINDNNDVIGSVANFFHKHGWQPNQGIAQHARIRGNTYKHLRINPKRANYHYAQLTAAGVLPVTAAHNHPKKAGLIELITASDKEYWIAYPNFFVIMRYNNSPQYAMVVYLLSSQLKTQWTQLTNKKHRAYV